MDKVHKTHFTVPKMPWDDEERMGKAMEIIDYSDLEIVAAAFLVHCAGGSGGDPRLCRLADEVLKKYDINWDTVGKVTSIHKIEGPPNG